VALRRQEPVFQRRRFFAGEAAHGGESDVGDIEWFSKEGTEMRDADWRDASNRCVMVFLNGEAIPESDRRGQRIVGDSFLVLYNPSHESVDFTLPEKAYGDSWRPRLDTADDHVGVVDIFTDESAFSPGVVLPVAGRSVLVLARGPLGEK